MDYGSFIYGTAVKYKSSSSDLIPTQKFVMPLVLYIPALRRFYIWNLENFHCPCRGISSSAVTRQSCQHRAIAYILVQSFSQTTVRGVDLLSATGPVVYAFTTFVNVLKCACCIFFVDCLTFHISLSYIQPATFDSTHEKQNICPHILPALC
jgi:hypothetical protein